MIVEIEERKNDMNVQFQTPHERMCFETATHFSAVRGRGSRRTRADFLTFGDALDHADLFEDGKTMIYAINDLGDSAHICNR